MLARLQQLAITIVAMLAIWFCVALTEIVTGSIELRNMMAILAFMASMALWLVLALTPPKTTAEPQNATKAKRTSGTADDRLALLLSLMTADERHTLQARLADELAGDGEISLADLLAAQDNEAMFREKAP